MFALMNAPQLVDAYEPADEEDEEEESEGGGEMDENNEAEEDEVASTAAHNGDGMEEEFQNHTSGASAAAAKPVSHKSRKPKTFDPQEAANNPRHDAQMKNDAKKKRKQDKKRKRAERDAMTPEQLTSSVAGTADGDDDFNFGADFWSNVTPTQVVRTNAATSPANPNKLQKRDDSAGDEDMSDFNV